MPWRRVHRVATDPSSGPSTKVTSNTPGYNESAELISPTEPSPATTEMLLAFAGERLARYKVPRSIDYIDELPRLPTGKLYKRLLKDRYWADRDSRIV